MQSNISSRNLIEPIGAFFSLEFTNFHLQKTHLLNTIILSLTQKIIYSFENCIMISKIVPHIPRAIVIQNKR
jgi:hypothetical protein